MAEPFDTGGRLIYAIGDIHGRADLLARMLEHIVTDAATQQKRFVCRPMIIFLGDYVDRGRQSRQVIDVSLLIAQNSDFEVRFLLGNHEEAMLDFLDHRTIGAGWSKRGGRATMESYGIIVPPDSSDRLVWSSAREALRQKIPAEHVQFLRSLETSIECGNLFFVHAGVRPDIPLDAQTKADMLWIRREFLDHKGGFERVIVHGHTPAEQAFLGSHRVGLDTGAYASGLLSAARFDGSAPILMEVRAGESALASAS